MTGWPHTWRGEGKTAERSQFMAEEQYDNVVYVLKIWDGWDAKERKTGHPQCYRWKQKYSHMHPLRKQRCLGYNNFSTFSRRVVSIISPKTGVYVPHFCVLVY